MSGLQWAIVAVWAACMLSCVYMGASVVAWWVKDRKYGGPVNSPWAFVGLVISGALIITGQLAGILAITMRAS